MRHVALPVVTMFAASLALGSCGGMHVRRVTYRLPGLISGPVDHGSVKDARRPFGEVFCGTLRHLISDAGETWGDCRKYIEVDSSVEASLGAMTPVRVLVVAGVFSECLEASGVKAFLDAKKHLEDTKYHTGISLEHVPVSALGSSSNNANEIRDYVLAHPGKFVALGYSKGAGDLMEAIATYPEVSQSVLALVTIAGSVGGSRLPDLLGPDFVKWVERAAHRMGLPGCHVADGGGITSLSRPDRQAFLRKYPVGTVPSFSVAAVAAGDTRPGQDDRTISKLLRIPWEGLQAYSLDQDSQVIADDAAVPGGTLLAIARADHWAVALPFSEMTDPKQRRDALKVVDRNTYPRTALLEAILRTAVP